jgi:endonuclease/exonuclease/phosphatase family metal-dependent hydrolase
MGRSGVTFATFNVKDLLDAELTQEKLAWTSRMIARVDADVLALQEVGSAKVLGALLDELEGRGGYGEPVLGTADDRGIRCALVSRCALAGARVHTAEKLEFPAFRVGDPPPFGARIPLRRGVVYARVDAGALGAVHVLVAHFKSRRAVPLRSADGSTIAPVTARDRAEAELRSLVWRAAEALHVRRLVDDLVAAEPDARVVVMGDLNDVPDSVTLDVVCGEGAGALAQAARRVETSRRYSVLHEGERAQIDHVLLTANIFARVTDVRFVNDQLREHEPILEGTAETPTHDSDHAPLVVRVGA